MHLDLIVADIQTALLRALAAGGRVEAEVKIEPWGKFATLSDPFGRGFCLIEFLGRGYCELEVVA